MTSFLVKSCRFHILKNYLGYNFRQMASLLDKISSVEIDKGKFKYVLLKVHHSPPDGQESTKFIVRGFDWAPYHGDIYDRVAPIIEEQGLDCECVGGGRMAHDPDKKSIHVFGYSQGFGKADHALSCELLKAKYPDYDVKWSDEGY